MDKKQFEPMPSPIEEQRIKFRWTCSDFCYHHHKTYIGAWLCGKVQLAMVMLRCKLRKIIK